jgi:hypothetical protein
LLNMWEMATCGVLMDELTSNPQYPVAVYRHNPSKLCNFPLVTLRRLLY